MPYVVVPNNAWNAGARSRKMCTGDCQLQFSISTDVVGVCVGLSTQDVGATLNEIPFALLFQKAAGIPTVFVYESGVQKSTVGPYTRTDLFTIRRNGTVIKYLKNNTVVYTSAVASTGTLFVDTSLYASGDKV